MTQLFYIQRRLAVIMAMASFIFACINAFYIFFIYKSQIEVHAFPYVFTRVYLLIGIGIIQILTGIKDSQIVRISQVFIFILIGTFYILINESGDLGGILFFSYAMLLSYQYKFMKVRPILKIGLFVALITAAELLSTFLKPQRHLSHGITSVIITLVFFYITTLLFRREIEEYKDNADKIMKEFNRNRIFIKTGRNLAGLVHNMKSKMAAIHGFNELLLEEAENNGNNEMAEYARLQQQAISLMTTQIRNLLFTMANSQETEAKPVSLNRMMDGSIEVIKSFENFRHDLNITRNLTKDDTVFISPLYLTEIIENVILNSLEAIPEGSVLPIQIESKIDNEHLILSISDSGPGISEYHGKGKIDCLTEEVFKPGKTTKPSGSGIGMSSSVEMIRASGGKLFLTTGPEGTRFDIHFLHASNGIPAEN